MSRGHLPNNHEKHPHEVVNIQGISDQRMKVNKTRVLYAAELQPNIQALHAFQITKHSLYNFSINFLYPLWKFSHLDKKTLGDKTKLYFWLAVCACIVQYLHTVEKNKYISLSLVICLHMFRDYYILSHNTRESIQ